MVFYGIQTLGFEAPLVFYFVPVHRAVRAFILLHDAGSDEAAHVGED